MNIIAAFISFAGITAVLVLFALCLPIILLFSLISQRAKKSCNRSSSKNSTADSAKIGETIVMERPRPSSRSYSSEKELKEKLKTKKSFVSYSGEHYED